MLLPTPEQAVADLQALGVTASAAQVVSLLRYCDLLGQWQARINLVGPKTLATVWQRHILDTAQLLPLVPPSASQLTDIGSGAGFPALVLAILSPALIVTCVESDTRKCAFLQTVVRDLRLNVTIQNKRLETHDWAGVEVVTARALAALVDLTPALQAAQAVNPRLVALLPKGAQAQAELDAAPKLFQMFHVKHYPSVTDPAATILVFSPHEAA